MIPLEEVKALKPGTVLYRFQRGRTETKIFTTLPIVNIAPKMVMFEGYSIATYGSNRLHHRKVSSEYFLSQKDAFLGALQSIKRSIRFMEGQLESMKKELKMGEEVARKKGWL